MNPGNVVALLFGIGFIVGALLLYRAARRASGERRFFRLSAYSQMAVLFFAGAMFILIGLLG
jgi:hypothetical protein